LKRFCYILKTDNQSEILEKLGKLIEIEDLLTAYLKPVTTRGLSQWLTTMDEIRERESHIIETLRLSSPQEIESKIDTLIQDQQELNSLQLSLKSQPNSARISELVQIENLCLEICHRLDLHNWRELSDTLTDLLRSNTAMNELEEQIMVTLSVVSPEAILPKISDLSARLSKQTEFLQTIATAVRTKDVNHILQRVQNLIQLRNDIKDALHMLQTDNLVDGITRIIDERK
jgi:hypothetical protein